VLVGGRTPGIRGLRIDSNNFEGMLRDAIILDGDTLDTVVSNNTISGFGQNGSGINLRGVEEISVMNNQISSGTQNTDNRTGILISDGERIVVQGNTIPISYTGISEQSSRDTIIRNNIIGSSTSTLAPTVFGIRVSRVQSVLEQHVLENTIQNANTAILIETADRAKVHANAILDGGTGIHATVTTRSDVILSGNTIDELSTGISVSSGDTTIRGNVL